MTNFFKTKVKTLYLKLNNLFLKYDYIYIYIIYCLKYLIFSLLLFLESLGLLKGGAIENENYYIPSALFLFLGLYGINSILKEHKCGRFLFSVISVMVYSFLFHWTYSRNYHVAGSDFILEILISVFLVFRTNKDLIKNDKNV